MADIKKIATRDSYGNALKELGAEFDNLVVLDADLAGATKTATFLKAFPDRHFDAGIAEANMVCMAAGMATAGLVPFASSFAMFAAGRAFEQIRNSVGYPLLIVTGGSIPLLCLQGGPTFPAQLRMRPVSWGNWSLSASGTTHKATYRISP